MWVAADELDNRAVVRRVSRKAPSIFPTSGTSSSNASEGGKPRYRGWGRSGSDFDTGLYAFQTIKPGRVALADGGAAAPHINFWIVSRGINIGLNTRMYFSDEAKANAVDPVLNMIESKTRRATLIARRIERDGNAVYLFDIRLQGAKETVFFDI